MTYRQWYSPLQASGLSLETLQFEEYLCLKLHNKAIAQASQTLSTHNNPSHVAYWKRQIKRAENLAQRSKSKCSTVSITFQCFWPGFNPFDNEILNLFRVITTRLGFDLTVCNDNADILIFSCFGNLDPSLICSSTSIFYTGENIHPNYEHADYSLSFDYQSYCGRNLYCPLWLLRQYPFGVTNTDYEPYEPSLLLKVRCKEKQIDNRVAVVANNYTPMRLTAIQHLRNAGFTVDLYGSHTNPVSDKIQTLNMYTMSLCFENSYRPGYVTEKLFDAFVSGTYPLYWGGVDFQHFSTTSFFNFDPIENLSSQINRLKDELPKLIETQTPLFRSGHEYYYRNKLITKLTKIVSDLFSL